MHFCRAPQCYHFSTARPRFPSPKFLCLKDGITSCRNYISHLKFILTSTTVLSGPLSLRMLPQNHHGVSRTHVKLSELAQPARRIRWKVRGHGYTGTWCCRAAQPRSYPATQDHAPHWLVWRPCRRLSFTGKPAFACVQLAGSSGLACTIRTSLFWIYFLFPYP